MLMHALACLLWDRIENVSSVPGGRADSFVSFISGELLGVERDTKMENGLSALAQRLCSPSGEGGGGGGGGMGRCTDTSRRFPPQSRKFYHYCFVTRVCPFVSSWFGFEILRARDGAL